MDKSAPKRHEVINAEDFRPEDYTGREVVFVKVPAAQGIGREVNFFGIKLRASIDEHPLIIGTLGAGALGWELCTTRDTLGKRLMTDDTFAETFRGGAFKDIHDKYITDFTRYYSRESGITQMITDPINRAKLQWKVGSEVKARGVGVLEAISKWRPRHWMTVAGAATAMSVGFGLTPASAKAQERADAQQPPLFPEDAPADWRGKVFETLKSQAQMGR